MNRKDLYIGLGMPEYYNGGSVEIDLTGTEITREQNRFAILDKVCMAEKLHQLGENWEEIPFERASGLLLNVLRYDIAYTSAEVAPQETALGFRDKLMDDFAEGNCVCYTNWSGSPWDKESGGGWDPLTDSTFDLGVVFMDAEKMRLTWFISED